MDLVLSYLIPFIAAALFGLTVVLAFGGILHVGRLSPDGYLVYFVVPLVVAIAAHTLASGRNLSLLDPLTLLAPAEPASWAKWVQRGATLFFLAAAVERLTSFILLRPLQHANDSVFLMMAFIACWVSMVALPAAFGAKPSISHDYFYPLLIGLAALTTTDQGARTAIRVTRDALLGFTLLGLVLLAIKRDMVLAPYIGGLVPAFPWRYSGPAAGPNAMAPLCVLGLVALRTMPYRRRWLQKVAVLLVLSSLLLTQSKTSWIAAVLCWAAMSLATYKGPLGAWLNDSSQRSRAMLWLGLGQVCIVAMMFAQVMGFGEGRIEHFLSTRAGDDMLTLTGRNMIWEIALDIFQRHPWFGYGPTIWDPSFRLSIGMPSAFHAHNQIINVLAAAGLAGAVGFLIYLIVLLSRLRSRLRAYHGFAAGLMALIVTRCFSEVPFNLYGFGAESLTQMLLLMVLSGAPPDPSKLGSTNAGHGNGKAGVS